MTSRPTIAFSWRHASLGVAYAVPAAVTTVYDRQFGLALAIGVLPAAALGLRGPRRERVAVVVVGAVAALSQEPDTSRGCGSSSSPDATSATA